MQLKSTSCLLPLLLLVSCVSYQSMPVKPEKAAPPPSSKNCVNDAGVQIARSKELQKIVEEDQAPRKLPREKIDWVKLSREDEVRIKRVAEIFAEGCLKTAKDYAAAALVFQHGTVPDHYYQTYLWSKKAVDLGDESQKQMIANAIDRYLINSGYKQIFAAQTFFEKADGCRCLEPTEDSFSENIRKIYTGRTLKNRLEETRLSNAGNPKCEKIAFCVKPLKTPPKGLFPGIW